MLSGFRRSLASFFFVIATLSQFAPAQTATPDLVLIHGHILTVDAKDSVAQAMAIRGGVIVKVGSDAEVLEFESKARGLHVIDLQGHTVTPGLIDTHAHIAEGGV